MGRTAGQPARVAGADRPSGGAAPGRPALRTLEPVGRKPLAPRAPASVPPPAPPKSSPPEGQLKVSPQVGENLRTVREIIPPFHVMQEKLGKAPSPSKPTLVSKSTRPGVPVGSIVPIAPIAPEQGASEALAIQEAINSMWAPASQQRQDASVDVHIPPPSGVRMSEPGDFPAAFGGKPTSPAAQAVAASAIYTPEPRIAAQIVASEDGSSDLSFKVYTLADLERRSDAPISMRTSRANFDMSSSRSARHWSRAYATFRAFVTATLAWSRARGERPAAKVALRKPFDALGDDLQLAVESIDWKTIGVRIGIVVGATLTLLFAVLTAAELTDDLKPAGAASRLASSESTSPVPARNALGAPTLPASTVAPATNMAAGGMQVVPAPLPPPPAMQVVTAGEIDEPAAAPAPKKAAKRPGVKKSNKLSFRNADAVFAK